MLKSLGLVWIPGVMAGMMVVGRQPGLRRHLPIRHRRHDLAASGVAGLIVTLLMRARVFSAAAQLTLRSAEQHQPTPYRLAKSMPNPS